MLEGMGIVVIKTTIKRIDIEDLKAQEEKHQEQRAVFIVTCIMDSADIKAKIGFIHPALIGTDLYHLNLYKTFAIPHEGGGFGMGLIYVVASYLKSFPPSRLSSMLIDIF